MSLPPLAQSESKQALFARLGLTGPNGDEIHRMLLQEATRGRDRLSQDFGSLTLESQRNRYIQTPYKWDELSETAKHKEIRSIVGAAGAYTQPYYMMGEYGRVEKENWVARWYLWHSFRYRDNRDTRGRAAAAGGGGGNEVFGEGYGGKNPVE
ncbi:hypothetical protein BU26DRAFT_595821 [Trematosphaeria pertusa]|uniref:Uncharacterized protein n=1 Tax=Trematosphaeria pertusa TaxID=390896 RepID=A0A6A6IBR0_9PLEO|nr:uncharacterized protein BU26DRAFT_595821 [Trematosphaeria pertusa]KAF2248005.1 hypothetical protein BU26DRAFT_595821 [Trematosphaeria pertusa]